ncbi:helix-turn-helix domain-containing protein [Paenibacillus sp. LMG 31458]|uniref:Helix-turn-helix domain-containing protein n=1 Tax=Paenibacillus phytorum TaxID=2654977 RepID=A0ABX1Y0K7_9BACL|nr:AraC family transcriptional regulator [Paenibacillus phytorum]NOU74377.1 helix-turn-helix domain-containing protein [Paenibacillus phytorum]
MNQDLWSDLKSRRLALLQALQDAEASQWVRAFEQLEKRLESVRKELPDRVRAFFVDVLWEIGAILYAKGIRFEEISVFDPFDDLKQSDTLEETLYYVKQHLVHAHCMIHRLETLNNVRYSAPIANAKKFLDMHYREEVTQSLVSRMVGFSESYLSRQFVKEVGCNYIDYLTNLRIEEAKRLLGTGIKISDISGRIGYLNPEHFSRMFKKMTGYSPKAYRDSLRRE